MGWEQLARVLHFRDERQVEKRKRRTGGSQLLFKGSRVQRWAPGTSNAAALIRPRLQELESQAGVGGGAGMNATPGSASAGPSRAQIPKGGPRCAPHFGAEWRPRSPRPARHRHAPRANPTPLPSPPHAPRRPHQPAGSRGNPAPLPPEVDQRQRWTCASPSRGARRQAAKEHAPASRRHARLGRTEAGSLAVRPGIERGSLAFSVRGAVLLKTKLGAAIQRCSLTTVPSRREILGIRDRGNGEFIKLQKEDSLTCTNSAVSRIKRRQSWTQPIVIIPMCITLFIPPNAFIYVIISELLFTINPVRQ